VHLHELGDIKFGLLEDLHLADEDVLDREDTLALFIDLLSHELGKELLDELLQVALSGLLRHNLHHLLADLALLGHLSVASLLQLVGHLLGEGDAEEPDEVSVGSLNIDRRLNDTLPLLDEGSELDMGHIHAVEVGETVVPLHVLDLEPDLPVSELLVLVQVGETDLENAAHESGGGDLGPLLS